MKNAWKAFDFFYDMSLFYIKSTNIDNFYTTDIFKMRHKIRYNVGVI